MNIFKNLFSKSKKSLCVVQLMGGLGNQMFEYAFAKALEYKTGNTVLFDKSRLENSKKNIVNEKNEDKNGVVVRDYELAVFNTDIKFADKKELSKLKKRKITETNPFIYDEDLLKDKGSALYTGYFQNEKYFKCIEEVIKNDFKFPEITDEFNLGLINKIRSCENSVFIHLRRGDYMNLEGWALSVDYYKRAIDYMLKNVSNPTFFVFGQDCEKYIKEEFDMGISLEIVGEKNSENKTDWKDIILMKECKHAIIANSSFSWWAAWLGNANSKGIVIAPNPFVKGQNEIICDNWVKIDR